VRHLILPFILHYFNLTIITTTIAIIIQPIKKFLTENLLSVFVILSVFSIEFSVTILVSFCSISCVASSIILLFPYLQFKDKMHSSLVLV